GSTQHPSLATCHVPSACAPRPQTPSHRPFFCSVHTHAPSTRVGEPSARHRHPSRRPSHATTRPSQHGVSYPNPARSSALTWPCGGMPRCHSHETVARFSARRRSCCPCHQKPMTAHRGGASPGRFGAGSLLTNFRYSH
ncbi:hypothetical protein CFOL_v3_15407, partial [Cephalotus follicularis]